MALDYWFNIQTDDEGYLFEDLGIYGTGKIKDNSRLHVVIARLIKNGYKIIDSETGTDKNNKPTSVHFTFN